MITHLIFVYNAHSGKMNAVLDSLHKMVSPATYDCKLCELTYGILREKEEWVRFRESVKTPMNFLHKDEFLKLYRSKWLPKFDYPVILAEYNGVLENFITAKELDEMATVNDLIKEVQLKLVSYS